MDLRYRAAAVVSRFNPHVRTPSLAPRWAYDRPAKGENPGSPGSIPRPFSARWRDRVQCPPVSLRVGDFALLGGRVHQITAILPGFRSSRPKFELQDLACPDMPRHRVAWSEIKRFARAEDLSEAHEAPDCRP